MPKITCPECDGNGYVEVEDPKMSLFSLLEPFIEGDMIGFRLKSSDASIPKLPTLEEQELFPKLVETLHNQP